MSEFNTLNQLCNIKSLLLMVKQINNKMRLYKDNTAKCLTFFKFIEELNDGE